MRRILLYFYILSLSLRASALEVELSAKSAILMNAKTGVILYDRDSREKMFPASVTKIATALFVLDEKHIDLGRIITVSSDAMRQKPNGATEPPHWITSDSSVMGLVKGAQIDLEGLLHGLLMVSGNDAANVIGESVSGSVPIFVQELNAYLSKVGCVDTCFVNPHGYHHPNHISTAYDLCFLMKKALTFPKFREIIGKQTYRTTQKPELDLKQTNKLMRSGEHFYSKAIGGKTGFHSMAQNNLVAAAEDRGRTLIAVVLGCPKSDDRFRDAKVLFEAAFAEELIESALVTKEQKYLKILEGAKHSLIASISEPLVIKYYPAETPTVKGFVYWDSLTLPIQKGQKVGEIKVIDERGEVLAREDLIAEQKVESKWLFFLKEHCKRLFGRH